jgi:hypothetical protein
MFFCLKLLLNKVLLIKERNKENTNLILKLELSFRFWLLWMPQNVNGEQDKLVEKLERTVAINMARRK